MRILLIAPHPFYQERGTPIAVDLLLRCLSERGEIVDVATFHEGIEKSYPNVRIHRINPWFRIRDIPPGFSPKKLLCDVFLFFKLIGMLRRTRYDVIHAIEETVFMAMLLKPFIETPFIYDMDALLSSQLVDKFSWLKPVQPILHWMESWPIKKAKLVVPMCDAIADTARRYRNGGIVVLKDVSLVNGNSTTRDDVANLREESGITDPIVMYIGNLEVYQGMQLLLDSIAIALETSMEQGIALVIIGGKQEDINHYQDQARVLKIDKFVYFLGPKPVDAIEGYMSQADVLASPRTQGVNTPMKVYSYLDSGVPILATRLFTHTQVLTDETAMLVEPNADAMAQGLTKLLNDPTLCRSLSERAKDYVKREHSYEKFKQTVDVIYDQIAIG